MKNISSINERVKKYAYAEISALYNDFQISTDGYNHEQAENSRVQYGENLIIEQKADTVWHCIRRAFVNPFTIILFVLASISFITDVILPSNFSRNVTTVFIIVSMLIISGIVRFIQEMRSKKVTDDLSRIVSTTIFVRRDGVWKGMASEELVVGDTIRLQAGDCVPADVRLTMTRDLFISQSVITGESSVSEKNSIALNPLNEVPYAAYCNTAFAGTSVIGGSGEGIILAVGKDTVYGDISGWSNVRKNKFDRGANSIAWVLIRFMAVLVPVVFVACGLTKGDWVSAFLFALSVAVGLTPEMLPMVINACLAKGSAAMGQKETVVKNINAMQSFGSMDVLCVDKTGTLTGDTILLEYYMDILGNECSKVLDYAYLNSMYHTGVKNHLDTAILKCRKMPGRESYFSSLPTQYPKLDELPFDYERKFVSVLVKGADSNILLIKGDIDQVCRRCGLVEYRGKLTKIQPGDMDGVHTVADELLEDGMKVLAVAYKPLEDDSICASDEQDFILLGYLVFFDAPKKSAASAIEKLQSLHVGVKVLTGDQRGVAISICRRLGMEVTETLTGAELELLPEDELPIHIEQTTVFAELSPKQKANIVEVLQSNGYSAGFLGDGMNDLPAMTQADVGISVDTSAEAVQKSSDVILLKKDLNVLSDGILEGRKAFANMSKYIKITASSNFGNILSIVIASVFLPFLPMTMVQLLLLNLLYDVLCLVLPWDTVDKDIYSLPREWSGKTLGRFMRFFGPISSVFDLLTFAFLYFILCPFICGGDFTSLPSIAAQTQFIAIFQTGWFLESMWTQVLILHLLRTKKLPLLQSKPSFPVMTVTIFGIVVFTALPFTPLGTLFGLTSMPLGYLGFLAVNVILYMLLITLAKTHYLKKYHELI
ncbi:MAG: magnesium-translocating P-type ATPase [Anaerostipes sp.]|jgi:Mg2+-importing ATPase